VDIIKTEQMTLDRSTNNINRTGDINRRG